MTIKKNKPLFILSVIAIFSCVIWSLGTASRSCYGLESQALCMGFYQAFIALYCAVFLTFAVAIFRFGNSFKLWSLLLIWCVVIYLAKILAFNDIIDFRTYSYEVFIISMYLWLATMLSLAISSYILPRYFRHFAQFAGSISLFVTILFIFEGRASVEHITPFLGGTLAEFTLRTVAMSKVFWVALILLLVTLISPLVNFASNWIKNGKFGQSRFVTSLRIFALFVGLLCLPAISIIPATYLNNNDIAEAKIFINKLAEKADNYYKENGEYPKILDGLLPKDTALPRLIDIYTYLAEGTRDAFYFSRPQKYCFIFQDPGKDFGYYSITSDRKWTFSHEGANLATEFLSVCDEADKGMFGGEQLIAGHLGMDDKDNPFAELDNILDNEVRKPAVTQAASHYLDREMRKLGNIDPSIYGNAFVDPKGDMEIENIDQLRLILEHTPGKEDPIGY